MAYEGTIEAAPENDLAGVGVNVAENVWEEGSCGGVVMVWFMRTVA